MNPRVEKLVKRVKKFLDEHSEAYCWFCLEVTALEDPDLVLMSLESQYPSCYSVEHGVCFKCKERQEVVKKIRVGQEYWRWTKLTHYHKTDPALGFSPATSHNLGRIR